ncbi:MAG: hypothetical protein KBT28_10735 [Bacteroidales bacterium]|nr:hypothetical protein [Candidatus Colimorpha merdihippi]
MSDVISIGVKKIYVSEIADWANTVMPVSTSSDEVWKDLGDVYEDTATLEDADPEIVTHKSETSSKKIVTSKAGDCTLTLSLMDPSLDQLQRYFGGTITTGSGGKKSWTRPSNWTPKPFALYIVPEDGDAVMNPCCGITPKFQISYTKNGIMLVPMTITLTGDTTFTEDYDPDHGPMYHA